MVVRGKPLGVVGWNASINYDPATFRIGPRQNPLAWEAARQGATHGMSIQQKPRCHDKAAAPCKGKTKHEGGRNRAQKPQSHKATKGSKQAGSSRGSGIPVMAEALL